MPLAFVKYVLINGIPNLLMDGGLLNDRGRFAIYLMYIVSRLLYNNHHI